MSNATDSETTTLEWSVIEARGNEAEVFLQGQLSQDLTSLDEDGSWTLVLAPDSVVVTAALAVRREEGIDLVVPRELAEMAAVRLRRFLLRTRCTLVVRDADAGPYATLEELIDARWPGANEFARSLTPHSFGRHFVDSTISFQKGCFTGQELVGRLDARGSSVPWRFVRVVGPSVGVLEEVLTSKGPDGPKGLTSWRERAGVIEGLGVVHRTLIGVELPEGVTVEEIE
jgi:folate-binding Fe-S cluster repair protein YgfZ